MYIISARKNSRGFVKGYKCRLMYWICILYYKLLGYEINYGDD